LPHVEKTEILIHCIDAAAENPKKIYETVRNEFKQFNPLLLNKLEIILITKTDLVSEKKLKEIIPILKKIKKEVLTYSLYNQESIAVLKQKIKDSLKAKA